jgi:hypothetical protein
MPMAEDIVAYSSKVEQLLDQKRAHLEKTGVKKLRDSFQALQIYFENIFNILIRKGLIQEDPYKYDEKISEVDAPSDEAFLDSNEQEMMDQRISQFHTRLEFLNNYYEYSVDFLHLGRIKRIMKVIKYISWSQITETAVSPTTRSLAKYLGKIRHGTDPMSASIINDSVVQIEKTLKTSTAMLGELAAYQKERYKLDLRQKLISRLAPVRPMSEDKIDSTVIKAKLVFAESMGHNVPFYPDLLKETLIEDYTADGDELKRQVLDNLRVEEVKKEEKKKEDVYRTILVQAVRYLASCNLQLEDALNKLAEAHQILLSQQLTFGRKLKKLIYKLLGRAEGLELYEVEYFDPSTSSNRLEKVAFQEFAEEAKRLIQLFAGLSSKGSPTFHKLENSSETGMYSLLNHNLINLQLVHRRMNGLFNAFRADISKDKRAKVRGIKLELNAIKNSVVKANQKKHEYVAIKEEEEQMKRLGLKKEPN